MHATSPQSRVLHRRLWQLAWPLILSNITVPLLGLVDTAVLGHLESPVYLGAVAIGANLFTFVFWAFGFLKMGTTGLTAQAWGASDSDRHLLILLRSALVALAIGGILILNQFWLIPVGLSLMQTSQELVVQATAYSDIRILGAPAILLQYVVMGWLIGSQRTREALFIAISTNVVNIVLDLVFVMGLEMRADGVALASLIAESYAAAFGLWLCIRGEQPQIRKLLGDSRMWDRSAYKQLLKFNTYLFIRTILLLFTFAFFVAQGAQLGTETLAANAVLLTFLMLISNALDGFANGAEALCGEAIGKQDVSALHRTVMVSGIWSVITATGVAICFYLLGEAIVSLLTSIDSVKELALTYLPWLIVMPILGVWSYLFDGVFIGATKVRAMRDTILLADVVVFFPAWWLSQPMGNHGLWLSLSLFLLARGLFQGWFYWQFSRKNEWLVTHFH